MNKALVTLVLVLFTSASGQTVVVFNNLGGYPVTTGPEAGDRNILASDHILVQLLWVNPLTGGLEPVGNPAGSWPLPTGGVFNGGMRQVRLINPTWPGWTWQIHAWEEAFGTGWPGGYEAALSQGGAVQTPLTGPFAGVRGGPVEFQAQTSDLVSTWLPPPMAGSIPPFYVAVPEPSVILWGLLSLGLFWRPWRRQ